MTHTHEGHQVTFAQTWDVSCGIDDVPADTEAPSLPRCSPQLAAAAPGGLRQILLAIGPESARAARDFTMSTLHDWQLDSLAQEAVLIASELVTNAIRHGCGLVCGDDAGAAGDGTGSDGTGSDGTKVELAWQRQASRVICMVTDRSPLPPVLGSADRDAESGRGLQVVQALAATWGWMMLGATSKAVWAALSIPRQL